MFGEYGGILYQTTIISKCKPEHNLILALQKV